MVFARIKQMIFVALVMLVVTLFYGCFGYIYSEKEIKTIVSDKLSKISIGMTMQQTKSIIGEPENIYTEKNTAHYRSWMKMRKSTIATYPENLMDNLPNTIFEHMYIYKIAEIDSLGFGLYFNEKNELLGWFCQNSVIPDDWDDICAKQDKLRLSTQSQ